MKYFLILFFHSYNCLELNETNSAGPFVNFDTLDALVEYQCRECGHDFNDGGMEQGRMVTVMPLIHPVFKVSLEFYVWTVSSDNEWDNIFHFTRDTEDDGHTCIHRQIALWVKANPEDSRSLITHISACVNGEERVLNPVVSKDALHELEYGQYASKIDSADTTHHFYVRLDGEIIHEELNTNPITFQDVKVYVSDPWWPAAYGLIRNFKYRKYDDFCLNHCP